MRSDRDKRSDKEREIDEFLSQFETPVEDLSSNDVNSYINNFPVKEIRTDNPGLSGGTLANKPDESGLKRATFSWNDNTTKPNYDEYVNYSAPSNNEHNDFDFPKQENVENHEDIESSRKEFKRASRISPSEKLASLKNTSENLKNKVKNVDKKDLKEKLFLVENPHFDPSNGETYMLAGKKIKNTPMIVSGKKIIRDVICFGIAMVLCFMLYCLIAITFAPKYNPHDIYSMVDQSSIVYDDQGKQVDSIFYTQNRKIIKYKDMPEDLINSFVAIEDKTFWKHHGFNWIRMAGAVVSSITGGGQISGTSTITQQLARNVYLADIKSVRSIKRKVLEMYYASRIEASLSKEEIVEAYLNTIYLGYGCYGVDAAAKSYFSKEVGKLSLVECASLAALPQAPDTYALVKMADSTIISDDATNIIVREPDTYVANDTAKFRRQICLNFMLEQGYITKAQHDKVYDMDLIDYIKPKISSGAGESSYFHEYLIDTLIEDLMEEYGYEYEEAERIIYTQGLKIYSTMDSMAQKTIIKEFKDGSNFPGLYPNKDSNNNIVGDNQILLYDYDNFFDNNGNFVFKKKEAKVNSDGSITIYRGNRLNIYETTVAGETDYSLEFKQTYVTENGTIYSIPGGYINVPGTYKSADDDGNLIISADFFADYPDAFKVNGDKITITETAYSLPQKTIQPQAAMVIVGVGTGEVKAMVGGRSTKGERLLNRAVSSRQPGSSIKPLAVYGSALQKSYELCEKGEKWKLVDYGIDKQGTKGYGDYITTYSSVADERTHMEGRDWPTNAGGGYSGKNTFTTAIQQSINTCAVKIQLQVGADFSANQLKKFGLTTIETEDPQVNDLNPAALALGGLTYGVKPLEMALAYASFPAGGKVNTPICYTKVLDRNGKELLKSKSEQTESLNEGVAWIMTEVLKSVVTNGLGSPAHVNNVQSGGKTGTTTNEYDIWFDGFTPNYAAALWIGSDNNIEMTSMSGPAAALWGKIMRQIPAANRGTYKEKPANVIYKNGCYFTKGTETGLSHYSPGDEKKMKEEAEKRAYEEWLIEREIHCHIDYIHDQYTEYQWTDTEGNIHSSREKPADWGDTTKYLNPSEIPRDDVSEVKVYDVGWRDGDFKWDGTIPDDIRKKYEGGA